MSTALPPGGTGYAVGTALAGVSALLFAIGSVVQHEVATRKTTGGTLSWRGLFANPGWLASQGATAVAALVQLGALALAPVSVVQPLLAGGLVLAIAIRAGIDRRWPRSREVLGAALAAGGLGVFLVAASPGQGTGRQLGVLPAALVAAVTVLVVVATALLARGRHAALICGLVDGAAVGIAAVLASAALDVLQHRGIPATLASGSLWGAIAAGAAGLYLSQIAFGRGPLSSSLPAITVVDPVVAVVAASVLLGEHLSLHSVAVWGPAAVVAAVGVAVLAIAESPPVGTDERDAARPG